MIHSYDEGYDDAEHKYLAEIKRLKAALEEEWRQNHWEKCGHEDCVSYGGTKPCHHERPAPIAANGQATNKDTSPGDAST